MKNGKTLKSRVLAWMITFAMVLSMIPITAFAEENPVSTGCTHIHDASCGYAEAVAEVPCDKGCTDTDENGVIDHIEDCAYRAGIDGQECNHIHDENCGGLPEEEIDENDNNNEIIEETTKDNESELSEKLKKLQESIDALPTGEEYKKMTEDEQEEIYEKASAISDEYIALSEEEQAKIDITRLEDLFEAINDGIETYGTETVTLLNSGYPYGKDMSSSGITLVVEAEGTVTSYQWQVADSKDSTFSDISDATSSTYKFTPISGKWYRCKVDDTFSEAVMTVKSGEDRRSWTKPYSSWYISNGYMAYMVNGNIFDAVGLYTRNNTEYMLCTSYGRCWNMYSSESATPDPCLYSNATNASLDALRVSFDASDDYNIYFEADLADGQQAFAFGCDTQLGNDSTSGSYSDSAALNAMVKGGVLQQIAMIGAATVTDAADSDPAFVIAPVDSASRFWIGGFSSRMTYAYNTSGGTATDTINGDNVVTLVESTDSGMTMSWMNISSGGSVKFRFSVGDVAHTGAVSGKVDYINEKLIGLDPKVVYIIKVNNEEYTITSDDEGKISLIGTDNNSKSYDFTGKTISVAKKDSEDTPAEIVVSGRPNTPDNPSDLEDNENDNSNPELDANIEIVELTTSSVTISPKEGQQYAYSIDNENWTTLTEPDSNGNYVISGLEEGDTVYVRTRISATDSAPASEWSDGKSVTLKSTVKVSVNGYSGTYDGENHSINVEVTDPEGGATITYSSTKDGSYSTTNPTFTAAGEYTVYYRVTAEGFYPTYGKEIVTINKAPLIIKPKANQFKLYSLDDPALLYDVEGLKKDDTITDALEGVLDREAGESIGSYNYTLGTLEADNYELALYTGDNVPQFEIRRDTELPVYSGIANGRSYCSDVTFTVKDDTLDKVTIDEVVVSPDENGKYKIAADNNKHTVVATDKSNNATIYTITVNKYHTWDGGKITTEPTCTEDGKKTFTCIYCGATMENKASGTATGHEYGAPIFKWSGFTSATATLICKKDLSHITSADCSISSEITKQATGTTKGQITHTATAVIDGKTYTDTKIEETETVEQEEVGDGSISTGVTVDVSVPDTVISNLTVEVAKELLSEEELEKVKAGSNLKVYLEVESKDKKVDSSEEKLITTEAEKQVKEFTKDVKVSSTEKIVNKIKYMDLSLYKKIDNDTPVKITDMNNNELEITIDIPENMRSKDGEGVYQVIRIHDKKVNILPSIHNKEKYTLTFKTDRFSTYAVTYVGKEKISAENTKVDESFRKLALKNTKSTNTSNTLSWAKVKEADGYLVYGNRCNQGKTKYAFKLLKTIKGNGTVSFTDKKLKKGTYYKYYVKAYKLVDGKKVILARGKTVHIATTGGKYGNPKAVKVNKDNVSLKVNKKYTIKASMVKSDKTIKKHEDIKYESSNTSVATVSSKGVITAKRKGTCTVYVYAQNGVYKKVKVTVK